METTLGELVVCLSRYQYSFCSFIPHYSKSSSIGKDIDIDRYFGSFDGHLYSIASQEVLELDYEVTCTAFTSVSNEEESIDGFLPYCFSIFLARW
ncbi:MAG: hypothetical protein RL106_1518 [Bacteroidota bacterium]|jgi:hypothetical protein